MSKNDLIRRQMEAKNNVMHAAERITEQFMEDTLEIAMKRSGHGYVTTMRMIKLWEDVRKEYKIALDPKHPEADVAQEHMDDELKYIVKDHQPFIPYTERYPEMRSVSYEVRRCGKR